MPPLSGHQTTLPTVHSGWSAHDLDCTMTELHLEGWKGWVYEYQNSWAICDINRIYCNLVGTTRFHVADTKLGISVQPNYPHAICWAPPNYHPPIHTHTCTHIHIHTHTRVDGWGPSSDGKRERTGCKPIPGFVLPHHN